MSKDAGSRTESRPEALVLFSLIERWHGIIERDFTVRYAAGAPDREAFLREHGPNVRAAITNGSTGISAELIARLPKLEVIGCFSAGYENVDLAAARARGIKVSYGPGANSDSVADCAIGLMLAASRDMIRRDRLVRAGRWADIRALTGSITGRRLGLIGYGAAARAIARRAEAFSMDIAYTKLTPDPSSPHRYVAGVRDLAAQSDFLVVAAPGGKATHHMVGRDVLEALGPKGWLVNIARGSLVDTAALLEALRAGTIAGAALDVYENEPGVPPELFALENTVLLPHIAGFTTDAFESGVKLLVANLKAHFAGQPLVTPLA